LGTLLGTALDRITGSKSSFAGASLTYEDRVFEGPKERLVDLSGIEPLTSSMPLRRSTN
jgi:hypothetical protein